jgi:voltage-gated potassium channel Kch
MKPRIIICGLGRTGYKIFCLLKQQGASVVGIHDTQPEALVNDSFSCQDISRYGACYIHGDSEFQPEFNADILIGNLRAAATLVAAGVNEAHTLVLTCNDDALNLAILTQARVLNPHIRIINRLFNTSLGDRLDHTLPDHTTMSVAALSAPVFAFAALGNRAIGQLKLFQQTWPIHEEYIGVHHPWVGRPLSSLWEDRTRMLIYYLPEGDRLDLISAVAQGRTLQVGDRLIVASQPTFRMIRKSLQQKVLAFASGFRQFQRHLRPTLVVLFTLLLTIFIATFTYVATNLDTPIVDALYFSVGMITGAGGNEAVAENGNATIKLFTVLMMLVGAGVVGICYALLNDFILGTRFQQLWNQVRIPQRHHYIICGLGGVGVQIMNQLRANGCDVLVIERDPTNRFLNAARSLKIPVITGDASLAATLQTANIRHAAALLAVTSDDVANLEIALSAKGLSAHLPVIVRNQDPQFAPLAQQVFDFEAVLSPAELAAPSFAAAALGGRILGNGVTADTLWIALATVITPSHPFCGRVVQEAAQQADFVPLYVETQQQTIHGWNLLDIRLSAGDVLYLTMPATQLEQLWRTDLSPLALPYLS